MSLSIASRQTFARAATIAIVAALAFMALPSGGCATKLETGYKPRALGSSADVRRGFYAQRFTPEAQKARQYEQDFGSPTAGRRKPGE